MQKRYEFGGLYLCPSPKKAGRRSGGGRVAILRSYSVTKARRHHFCDACFHEIEAGEGYHADVVAQGGYIIVMKRHNICPVDPQEEERRMFEDLEKFKKQEASKEVAMAAAA